MTKFDFKMKDFSSTLNPEQMFKKLFTVVIYKIWQIS